MAGDTVSEQTIEELTTQLVDTDGQVDGLVNNAGIAFSKPLEHTVEGCDKLMHINTPPCWSPPARRPEDGEDRGGSVVNVFSIGAPTPLPDTGNDFAPKAATSNSRAPSRGRTRLTIFEPTPCVRGSSTRG